MTGLIINRFWLDIAKAMAAEHARRDLPTSSSSSIGNDNIKILMALSYLWSQSQVKCIADLTRKAAGAYCLPASFYCITSHVLEAVAKHDDSSGKILRREYIKMCGL